MRGSGPTDWAAWWRARPGDSEPFATARRQGFVVSTQDLRRLGISRAVTRTRVGRGVWSTPIRGVVAPFDLTTDQPTTAVLACRRHAVFATSAIIGRRDHVVSGRSAAILFGLPTVSVPERAELTAPNFDGLGRQGPTQSFGALLLADSVTAWHGVLVTTVARTIIDMARRNRFDGVMAVDAALRAGIVKQRDLDLELLRAGGWPGVRTARKVVDLADPESESPLESVARLRLHDDDFPPPQLQVWIAGYRVDLCWPDQRLVLEIDGRLKYDAEHPDALWREKTRELALRRAGYEVERVIARDLYRDWPATSERLRRHFQL